MSAFRDVSLYLRLERLGLRHEDRIHAIFWWLNAKPGEKMMFVRYGAPNVIVDSDGNVSELVP